MDNDFRNFITAVKKGVIEDVRKYYKEDYLNKPYGVLKRPAIIWSIANKHFDIFDFLFKQEKIDIYVTDDYGYTILHFLLLNFEDSFEKTVLEYIFKNNKFKKEQIRASREFYESRIEEVTKEFSDIIIKLQERRKPKSIEIGETPINPLILFGRDKQIEYIRNTLLSKQVLLLINAEGGVGKTAIVSRYYHKYYSEYEHLIWLLATNGIEDTLIYLGTLLKIDFEKYKTKKDRLKIVIKTANSLSRPILFVLDNANKLDDLIKKNRWLRKLNKFHIILTSRKEEFTSFKSYKIPNLLESDLIKIFKYYYREKYNVQRDEQLLKDIFKAIGYNTLIVELLAKNLAEISKKNENYYLNDLLNDLQNGLLKLNKTLLTTDYKEYEDVTIEDIVLAMYNLVELSDIEKRYISIFSVLPSSFIPFEHLVELLPEINNEILKKLAQKGWLSCDKDSENYRCSPVIQEVVREKNKDRLADDTFDLVENLVNKLSYDINIRSLVEIDYKKAIYFIFYSEIITKKFEENYEMFDYITILHERIGNFYSIYGDSKKALENYKKYNDIEKKLFNDNFNDPDYKNGLAISYSKLGEIYSDLGDWDNALTSYQEQTRLFKELSYEESNKDYQRGLAISYSKLGNVYTDLDNLDEALKYYKNENIIFNKLYKLNKNFKEDLAISYSKLGEIYSEMKNFKKALECFEKDLDLTKESYWVNNMDVGIKSSLAISYQNIGEIHFDMNNFETALVYFKKYFILSRELYDKDPNHTDLNNGLAIAYSKLGITYFKLNKFKEALDHYKKDLKITKELCKKNSSNIDYKYNLAISYSKLGEIYLLQKQEEKSYNHLIKAKNILINLINLNSISSIKFEKDLKFINDTLINIKNSD